MKKFSDFNIKVEIADFTGDKIKISKILNREILVERYKIDPSKVNSGNCLTLQIELAGEKRIIFTSAGTLLKQIEQVPPSGFPFHATIIEENDRYVFI